VQGSSDSSKGYRKRDNPPAEYVPATHH